LDGLSQFGDWARANQRAYIFLFLSQKEILPFLLEQFSLSQAQLWQLGAGARVRRRREVNQGAL
jgi:hypothetical protein